MRDDWVEITLDGIADVIMGQSPDGKSYNQEGKGLPFMQGSAEFGEHNPVPEKWCSDPKKIAEPGDLLLSVRAPVGDTNFADQRIAIGRGLSIIRANKRSMTEFIRLVIQLNIAELIASSGSGMFASITGKNLKEFKVNLPPLPEQKRIVDLISSVDSYIEALQQQSERAKRSRNAVLHELLTAGGADWVETTLGNVCDFINGDRGKNYPSAKFRQSHGIPFINAGHLDKGIVNFDSMDFISEEVFEKLGSGKVQPGDTLFCLRGSVGKFANVEGLQKGAIASSLVIIRPKSGITKDFLMHYLDSEMCSSELKQSLTGAVQPNLSANNLKSFKISLPNIKSQIKIGELLGEFKVSITSLGVLIESTKNLRAGLLSDLLSGKHEIPASYDKVIGAA